MEMHEAINYSVDAHRIGRCLWCCAPLLQQWEDDSGVRSTFACGTTVSTSKHEHPRGGGYSVHHRQGYRVCVTSALAAICADIVAERERHAVLPCSECDPVHRTHIWGPVRRTVAVEAVDRDAGTMRLTFICINCKDKPILETDSDRLRRVLIASHDPACEGTAREVADMLAGVRKGEA